MSILEKHNLTVIRKNGLIPSVSYLAIKEKILGKKYSLSIIFCTPEESRTRNATYRDKDYPTNILSFPLDEITGEIYIPLSIARLEAKKFEMSYNKFLVYLLIHGCLHLKGYDHSSTMDRLEDKYLKQFFCD